KVPTDLLHGPPHDRFRSEVHHVVAQRPPQQELHRQIMDSLGTGFFTRATCLDPAVGDEVANNSACGFKFLSRFGGWWVHEVGAEQISIRPVLFLVRQSESLDATL